MGHTPGPWVVREPDADERLADIAEGRSPEDMELTEVYADDGGQQVCYVMNDTPDEAANAHLIAAAPELLAVCRNLLGCLSDWCEKTGAWRSIRPGDDIADDDDPRKDDHLAMAAAEVAIAKAEGRSE